MADSDIQEGTEERGKTGQERSTFDRRNDEGKEGSESRCDRREVDNRDVGVKKKVMKERKAGNQQPGRYKQRATVGQ